MLKEKFRVCKTVLVIINPSYMFLMAKRETEFVFFMLAQAISRFVHNSDDFGDFVTGMFCMVFPRQVFVNVNI